MSDVQYPDINGRRYSWASVQISIGRATFLGIKSVSFNEGVDPAKIHGTGQGILGNTAGQYDADGTIEVYQAEADSIISQLGTGWTGKSLTVQVQYSDDGQPVTTFKLPVRFTKASSNPSESAEAITTSFTMSFVDTIARRVGNGPWVYAVPRPPAALNQTII